MILMRRLLVGAALLAGLAPTARAAEPDKLIPAATDTVIQVNVRQILDSEIAKKYALEQLKQALDGQDIKKVLGEIGLDPLKDIDQLILTGSGSSKEDLKLLGIIHGNFSPTKLNRAAEIQAKREPDKVSRIMDGNTVIFKVTTEGNLSSALPVVFISVLDETTVVFANEQKMITQAVSAAAGNQAPAINKTLAGLIRRMDDKSSVFVASLVKEKLEGAKIPPTGNLPVDLSAFQDLLPKMETVTLTVNAKSDVTLKIEVGMKDEPAATAFRAAFDDFMKQIKPLAQFAAGVDPRAKPLGDILATIKSSASAREVLITGKVTNSDIGKIINPNQ